MADQKRATAGRATTYDHVFESKVAQTYRANLERINASKETRDAVDKAAKHERDSANS